MARAILESPGAVDSCDPALVLLGEGILRRFGPGIPEFEALARQSADALLTDPSVIGREPRLFPVSYLLESLGFRLSERQQRTLKGGFHEDWLSEASLQSLVNNVSKSTSFGSVRLIGTVQGPLVADEVKNELMALAYHRLHHYKLDEALMLIRAMNYAGMNRSKPFEEAMMYILAQQRQDGSFGFYADEIELIKGADSSSFDPSQLILLPTTVSAIWTVAEAMTDSRFSLFASVRVVNSASPPDCSGGHVAGPSRRAL